jgi:hypothetical protein
MKTWFQKKLSLMVLLFCIGMQLLNAFQHPQNNPISWDVFGYYLYLPALFIHHDIGLEDASWVENARENYGASDTLYQLSCKEQTCVMKYSAGMAVMYSPAFFVGHAFALMSDSPADGFSSPYQNALCVWSVLFAILGLVFLRKALRLLFEDWLVSVLLLLVVVGTNYLFTVIVTLNMPHNYLFTLYAILLYFTLKFHKTGEIRFFRGSMFVVALMALARPTELMAILLPLLWGFCWSSGWSEKIKALLRDKKELFRTALTFILIGGIQLLYWKIASNHWVYYSYNNPGEGLEFFHPHIIETLFSWRKGWLIYTPIMIFAVLGLFTSLKGKFEGKWALFFLLLLHFYVSASWTNWWYAESFSQRPLVQIYPLWSVALACFLRGVFSPTMGKSVIGRKALSWTLAALLIALSALNYFQHWQMSKGILKADRMTWDYYKSAFLQTSAPQNGEELLLLDRTPVNGQVPWTKKEEYRAELLQTWDFTDEEKGALKLQKEFDLAESWEDVASTDFGPTWVKARIFTPFPPEEQVFPSVVMTYTHGGEGYAYQCRMPKFNYADSLGWYAEMDYLVPEIRRENDEFAFQLYRQQEGTAWLSRLELWVYEKEER